MANVAGKPRATAEQKAQILADYSSGMASQKSLAEKHGFCQATISSIIKRSQATLSAPTPARADEQIKPDELLVLLQQRLERAQQEVSKLTRILAELGGK